MTVLDNPPLAEAEIRVLSEEELAGLRRDEGCEVVFAHGCHWQHSRGLYRRIHMLAPTRADHLQKPAALCWGFQTVLADADAVSANALFPCHLVTDLSTYDETSLESRKRRQVRACRRVMRLVRISDPRLLHKQGWEVFSATAERISRWTDVTRTKYLATAEPYVNDRRRLLVAALEDDILAGYLETYAVDGVAYLHELWVSAAYQRSNVGALLQFEAAQLYRRSGKVSMLCAGPHRVERPGLAEFKKRLGFPLVSMPAYVWMVYPARVAFRHFRATGYYRLTGRNADGAC